MEKNMHIESDHSVLDAPRIRTIAMETGYSSVNLYDEVDSTTTAPANYSWTAPTPNVNSLASSPSTPASTKAPDVAVSPEPGPPLPEPA